MAITKEKKEKTIKGLKEKISNQKSIVFVNFSGLKTTDLLELRKKLKSLDSELLVSKKTLTKIALKEKDIDVDFENLKGETALIFGFEDEIAPAKIAYDFSRKNKKLQILGGVLENKFRGKEDIISLAQLPSRVELLAKLVGTMNAPVYEFAGVLNGNLRNFVYLLSEISKVKNN